jgi:hypothetical protein
MRRRTFIALVIIAILVVFGQRLTVFPIGYIGGYWALHREMSACLENELRVERFRDGYERGALFWSREMITINRTSGTLALDSQWPPWDAGYGLFWMHWSYGISSMSPYLTTDKLFSPSLLDTAQLAKLTDVLNHLQSPRPPAPSSYRNQVHIVFWSQHQLRTFHFSNADASQLAALASAMALRDDFYQVMNN